jgi:septal ring-binding cell division protein DamX
MNGSLNLSGDTIKVMLVTSGYTPNVDTHDYRDDVTNEVSGTGYTAGGATLANKTVTQDNTNDRAAFDADDATWASSTITARGAVVYKARGGAASADELLCYFDFGSDQISSSGNFTLQWSSSGIVLLT